MLTPLREHWPEYLIEAFGAFALMTVTCVFGTLLEHPSSPVPRVLTDPFARRVLMGVLMAASVFTVIHLPWGKRSGAHYNPAVTLTFLRLGKVWPADGAFYVLSQCIGAISAVALASLLLGGLLADPAVGYVATRPGLPGVSGTLAAFAVEAIMAGALMSVVLWTSNTWRLHTLTPRLVPFIVMSCIIFGAPISGTSLNPARSLAPTLFAGHWSLLWIYFLAPSVGMLGAAQFFLAMRGRDGVVCAKLHHHNGCRCIFKCRYESWSAQCESLESEGVRT